MDVYGIVDSPIANLGCLPASSIRTLMPALARQAAATDPASPEPRITTSYSGSSMLPLRPSYPVMANIARWHSLVQRETQIVRYCLLRKPIEKPAQIQAPAPISTLGGPAACPMAPAAPEAAGK